MLEDQEEDAVLIERVLQRENLRFASLRVDTREDFSEALRQFVPDIVLSDHSLPHFNSLQALEIFKSFQLTCPFILVTGAVSEEFAVNCLKQGADDYVLKSNLSRLPKSIDSALRQREYENNRITQAALLVHQNKELLKINKELDSFVYSVSHNLRSPLSSVLGVVNIAKMDACKSAETVDHYFQIIGESILKLDQTLKEILDYSQNVRTELEVDEIDFNSIIQDALNKMSYLDGAGKIQHTLNIQQSIPFHSDFHRVSIIIDNVVSNAVRYADPSKVLQVIEVSAEVHPTFVSIEIRDNGIGIAGKHLPNIFDMFFRATERSEGAGLGLYIVKEMVEKLKGSITMTSVRYEQTIVSLTIPNKLITPQMF